MPTVSRLSRSLWIAMAVLIGTLVLDQASKQLATRFLQGAEPVRCLGNLLILDHALNPGGFLSLGSGLPEWGRQGLFIGFNLLLMTGVFAYMLRSWLNMGRLWQVGLTLILAGGIGNLIDRVTQAGLVTDFMVLRCGPLQTGVFNVADMAILAGALMVGVTGLQWERGEAESKAGTAQERVSLS